MSPEISLKDLISPVLVFIGLLLNALVFNKRLERDKSRIAVQSDLQKDTQKNRRDALFRLRNTCSIAYSSAKAILDAIEHPNKVHAIDALLPSLSQYWICIKTILSEFGNNYLDKADVYPYVQVKSLLVEYFFMLDNTKLGDKEYADRLRAKVKQIKKAIEVLAVHNTDRLKVLQ